MNVAEQYRVFDREEAGKLLSTKLKEYRGTEAIVVGIPRGGVAVASKVAELLSLPLEVLPCRKITDPVDQTKSIGSVCLDEVAVEHNHYDLPQDYISHQIALVRNGLRKEWQKYYPKGEPTSLSYRTVILIDDAVRSGDTMIACLKSIRKQSPLKVIVAVPSVSAEGAQKIGHLADEVVFTQMNREAECGSNFYIEFPDVTTAEVGALMMKSKKKIEV